VPHASIDVVVLNRANGFSALFLTPPSENRHVETNIYYSEAGEKAGKTLDRVLKQTNAPIILITTGNVSIQKNDVLEGLISNLIPNGVAAASAKIVDSKGIVDHCGLSFSAEGKILFPLRGFAENFSGHGAHGALPRNVAVISPMFSLFETDALHQISHSLSEYSSPCGAVIAACLELRDKGFRIVADGGLSVVYNSAPYLPDSEVMNDGSDFNRLKLNYLKRIEQGDPYYNSNLQEEPADFRIK
jgi:hypothetical protein